MKHGGHVLPAHCLDGGKLTPKWCSPGRRDSVWYLVCFGHMFVLELFMIRLLLIYQKHCSLSENIHLLVFAAVSSLVNAVA